MNSCVSQSIASVAVCLAAALRLYAQQTDYSKIEIKDTKVSGPIHMLEGQGGNIGVSAGPDGILIIDDQFAPLAEKIDAALKKIDPGPLKFLVNTHFHGDHTGGNAVFGKRATIIAHTKVRTRLSAGDKTEKDALPVVTYDDTVTLHFNGEEIRIFHVPAGHTDGDSVIYFAGSKVVHMGDQFFAGKFPFIDTSSGGTVAGFTKNIETVLKKVPEDAKVIPGHGPLSDVAGLKAFQQMLVETTAHVKEKATAGKSLEEIKAAGLPEKWKDWGTGFIKTDRWIETVYRSLKQAN